MDAKWMPVFAAAVGVLGGVGGALVGGSLANASEQDRLETERRDAREDLFRATHGEFLGAADALYISLGLADSVFNKGEAILTDDEELQITNAIRPEAREFFTAGAAVELLVNPEVAAAADKLRVELLDPDEATYDALRKNFIRLAKEEIQEQRE
jgi:hypothetical protein